MKSYRNMRQIGLKQHKYLQFKYLSFTRCITITNDSVDGEYFPIHPHISRDFDTQHPNFLIEQVLCTILHLANFDILFSSRIFVRFPGRRSYLPQADTSYVDGTARP